MQHRRNSQPRSTIHKHVHGTLLSAAMHPATTPAASSPAHLRAANGSPHPTGESKCMSVPDPTVELSLLVLKHYPDV